MTHPSGPGRGDLVEAALLFLAQVEDEPAEQRRERLADWRDRSPAHADALAQARAEWTLFSQAQPVPLTRIERLQLASASTWASALDHPVSVGLSLCGLLALVLVPFLLTGPEESMVPTSVPATIAASHYHDAFHAQEAVRYRTDRGEQKHVALPDGSSLWLNWNSEVLVATLKDEVHVDVLLGDALFTVSDKSDRPLVVHAGQTLAYAPRTQFTVHSHSPKDAFFQVKEGAVTIIGTDVSAPIKLAAAEQAYFENGAGSAPRPASLSSIGAWLEGKLIFDERPLIEVLYELAHYTEQPLRVGEVIDSGDRVSATFDLVDADLALLELADQYRLEVYRPEADAAVVRSIDGRRL